MLSWRMGRSVPAVEEASLVASHGLGTLHGVGDVPS
jgi:hypothetical protein